MTTDIKDTPWEDIVSVVSTATENRELYQKVLGKLAAESYRRNGNNSLGRLAKEVESMTGIKVSPASLETYSWVYRKLESIMHKIPEDYSYRVWRTLAGTDNPGAILDRAIEDGLSGAELGKQIRGEPERRLCPHCNKPI